MIEYQDFIKTKQIYDKPSGHEPKNINSKLFNFQKDIVKWSIRRGRAALWEDCGLGKTPQQLEWAYHVNLYTNKPILIFAPLAVSKQTVNEGKKFGINVNLCKSQDNVINGINITNYEKLHNFKPQEFAGVVLDECFPPDTKIDVFNIDKSLKCKYIKDIKQNDLIYNAQGEDYVKNIYKRKVNRAIRININGQNITCSENHPFFTMYGWKCAQDIQAGDYIMETKTAVRLVRNNIQTEIHSTKNAKILQSILLSEMENEYSRALCESSHKRSCKKKRIVCFEMEKKRQPESNKRNGTNCKFKSYVKSRNKKESIIDIAENEPQTFRAWGEWSKDDIATANNEGCNIRQLDTGICYITGKTSTKFSNMLQGRLRESRLKNSNRNRWAYSQIKKTSRRKERQETGFIRVESIEILELGHPDLEKYRDASGNIYFYDIKAKRHPSFSVNGLLVHNSSILKGFASKTRQLITESFNKTPYRLACTATPAPNDFMELANHAEFLGVMSRSEMLSTFFIHDSKETQKWRLKGHAQSEFWKWICSWAVMIRKPSDLGYNDCNFILPELKYHNHIVKINKPTDGFLFVQKANTLNERRQARKSTLKERCKLAVEIANNTDEQFLIWCDLNSESELLTKQIKGAVEIAGKHSDDHKENAMINFQKGNIKVLITKPQIAGFGINWQNCHNMVFVGLSDSFERFYQAVRRCWRFGQEKTVNVHIVTAETEGNVLDNIKRKESDSLKMAQEMVQYMSDISKKNIQGISRKHIDYLPQDDMVLPNWI